MSDMRLIVAGAGGRMGRALTRVISETSGAVVTGALEAPGSELLGKDSGVLAGLPANGVLLSADLWSLSANADGILDFTVPGATIANVAIAAQRSLVHIIGTTGLSSSDDAVIRSVTSRAIVVKSGNMSLGINLLAALVKRVAQSLDEDFDIEILEIHHKAKIDAPSGTALLLGSRRPQDRTGSAFRTRPRRHHRRAPHRRYRFCVVARRYRHRRSHRDFRRAHGAHRTDAPRRGSHHVRARRGQGRVVGARQEARNVFDGRRARAL
jgi:4-hydroxy-tetrahydrodipicolinate reductase